MTKTKKSTQLVTAFGRAGWCNLIRPNYKFKPEAGEFAAKVILTPEAAAPTLQILDELYERAYAENLAEVQKEKSAIKEIKRADKPYRNVEDPDTGQPLADFQIQARLKYKIIGKDDTGRPTVFRVQKPIVVDSKNNPILQEIGMGSVIRMSFIARGFYTNIGSGLTLQLLGVQVKEFIPLGMADPDFDDVDGYETTLASDPVETMADESETEVSNAPQTPDLSTGAEW